VQVLQRLPNRSAANLELLGERGLYEMFSGLEASIDD
jgi:hypothetical protein